MAEDLTSRAMSGRRRVVEAAACGAIAAAIVAWFVPWQLTVLVAWDVTAAASCRLLN